MSTHYKSKTDYAAHGPDALIRQSGIDALAQGEAALAHAARAMVSLEKLSRHWRAEWLAIAARNGEIRTALRQSHRHIELAPPVSLALVED